jgi:hypothetical protein
MSDTDGTVRIPSDIVARPGDDNPSPTPTK